MMRWKVAVAVVMAAALISPAGPASARPNQAVPGSWGTAGMVSGVGDDAQVQAVSCASPGNCAAVGQAQLSPGEEGFAVDEVSGVWGTAAPTSTTTASSGLDSLVSVSCASAGTCAAVGDEITATNASKMGYVVDEVDGAWGIAQEIPGLAALKTGQAKALSVSCGSPGNCAAVGWYGVPGATLGFVADEANGVWGNAEEVPGLSALGSNVQAELVSVSCVSAGNCTAGGYYQTSGVTSPLVIAEVDGSWGNAQGFSGTSGQITSVSCTAEGDCTAGGFYADSSDNGQGFVADEASGTWGAVTEVPGLGTLNKGGGAEVSTVSCASAGNCAAAGGYIDGSGDRQGFVANEANGSWGDAEEVPGLGGLNAGGTAVITSVSCGSPGDCGAGGYYLDGSSHQQAFVVSEVAGSWETAAGVPGLGALNTAGQALVASVSCASGGDCAAGGQYGVSGNPGAVPAFVVNSVGCQQVTDTDGEYEFGGCVAEDDGGTQDVTAQVSNLDGIDVSATAADPVTYDDGGSGGDALVSAGASTLSLDLDGSLIPVSTGTLDDQLTGPISAGVTPMAPDAWRPVTARKAPPKVAGVPLSGTLTVSPASGGTAKGQVDATLPAVLGGGQAKLTFSTTVNKGLSNVTVTATRASFLQLFSLSNLKLTYRASAAGSGTWQVTATASTGGTTATPFKGTLRYRGDRLTEAKLSAGAISLAGIVDVTSLNVDYTAKAGWSGDITFGQPGTKNPEQVSFTLSYDASGLASASVQASNLELFGVLNVAKFALDYAKGSWDVAVTTADGGGGSASLTVAGDEVTAASLKLTKISFLGKFEVQDAEISYARQAPNPACPDTAGQEIWCGSWQVLLPQASVVDGVSGSLATADGQFASGSIKVDGHLPLIDGIVLTSLGGSLTVNPPPTTIKGSAKFTFGPTISDTPLVAFDGTLTRALPDGDTSGSYQAHGDFSALGKLTGTVDITVPGDEKPTTVSLAASVSLGKAKASGKLTGSFTASTFSLTGSVGISIYSVEIDGSMAVDKHGMAACGAYKGHEAGFEYVWSTRSLEILRTKGCSEKGF